MDGWAAFGVDLDAFAGQIVYVRFAHDRMAQAAESEPAWWIIRDVMITVRRDWR
jgi:hypothetical protein